MAPQRTYIYAYTYGIILPNSSTFKNHTFLAGETQVSIPIRMQITHDQDFCSLANVSTGRMCQCPMLSFYNSPGFC